jgi:hypothetical protein
MTTAPTALCSRLPRLAVLCAIRGIPGARPREIVPGVTPTALMIPLDIGCAAAGLSGLA